MIDFVLFCKRFEIKRTICFQENLRKGCNLLWFTFDGVETNEIPDWIEKCTVLKVTKPEINRKLCNLQPQNGSMTKSYPTCISEKKIKNYWLFNKRRFNFLYDDTLRIQIHWKIKGNKAISESLFMSLSLLESCVFVNNI